jgi:succinate-acetate transporter protein
MSVESDVHSGAHAADQQPGLSERAAAAPAGNPVLLGLFAFLPAGITLGLWFLGYLDTATLGGGMIPITGIMAGVFMAISAIWAGRVGASAVAAILGLFAGFWASLSFLLIGATSGWWGITADNLALAQRTYLLSFLIVFALLTLVTLRLPLIFTAGFVFVVITFALAFIGVSTGNAGLFPIAGYADLIFCLIFAYILADGMGQELGGRPLPLGNPIQK